MSHGAPWPAWHSLSAFSLLGEGELTRWGRAVCQPHLLGALGQVLRCSQASCGEDSSLIQGQRSIPVLILVSHISLQNKWWCLLFSRDMLVQHLSIRLVKAMESGVIPNWNVNVRVSSKWKSFFFSQREWKDQHIQIQMHGFLLGMEGVGWVFEGKPVMEAFLVQPRICSQAN